MLQMETMKLPVHSRYPIFSALVALFCVIVPSEYKEPNIVELEIGEEEGELSAQTALFYSGVVGLAVIASIPPEQEPIRRGAYVNGPDFVDSEDDKVDTQEWDFGRDGNSHVVRQNVVHVASNNATISDAHQTPSEIHRAGIGNVTHTKSVSSFNPSEDSSFLSDIVNAMMMEESGESYHTSDSGTGNSSISTGSSDSEESDCS